MTRALLFACSLAFVAPVGLSVAQAAEPGAHASLEDLGTALSGTWAWSEEKSEKVARNASLDKSVEGLGAKKQATVRADLAQRTAIAPVAVVEVRGDTLHIQLDGPRGPRRYSAPFHGETAAAHLEASRRGDGIALVSTEHGGKHKVLLRPSTKGDVLQLVELITEPGLARPARVVLTYRRQG
jgi:hypothetical protein